MPEHQKHKALVAARVAAALGGVHELLDFGRNEVFAVTHHFVQCWGYQKPRNARNGAESLFEE